MVKGRRSRLINGDRVDEKAMMVRASSTTAVAQMESAKMDRMVAKVSC